MAAEFSTAMTKRSLRTIKNELEFLADSSVITQQQLSAILAQLPDQNSSARVASPQFEPPAARMNNLSLVNSNNEKRQDYYTPEPAPSPMQQPPPAYPTAPTPPVSALATATALYAYTPTDAGDLELAPNDRVQVTEYMNAEWWKGRSERTGQEGIFPRSYVRPDEKIPSAPTNYGNAPMAVSQGNGGGPVQPGAEGNNKTSEYGKKFGKKMGNAAIFGAGATMGSKIVNGIF